jgi:hypothetical protein
MPEKGRCARATRHEGQRVVGAIYSLLHTVATPSWIQVTDYYYQLITWAVLVAERMAQHRNRVGHRTEHHIEHHQHWKTRDQTTSSCQVDISKAYYGFWSG